MTWQKRLDEVLRSWLGTPYFSGGAAKGRGVDCRYFFVRVFDELYGLDLPLPERMPPTTAQHCPRTALWSLNDLCSRYPHRLIRDRVCAEPGDAIVCSVEGYETPMHCAIVGINKFEIWHATHGTGVHVTSFARFAGRHLRIYRPLNKESWACSSSLK
jgi:cell wall-associated NlpC family hydrolase